MSQTEQTLYERVGGETTFRRLVDAFYDRVEQDAVLRPLFPEDLTPGKEWQFMFLMQYWGGPTHYMEERGHPRLRMRHFPFAITPQARDAWVRCMFEAIDEIGIAEPDRTEMRTYFDKGATFMINRYEEASE